MFGFNEISDLVLRIVGMQLNSVYYAIYQTVFAVVLFFIYWKIIKILYFSLYDVLHSLTKKTRFYADDILMEHLKYPVFLVLIFLGFYWLLEGIAYLSEYEVYLTKTYYSFIAIIVGWFFYGVLTTFIENYAHKISMITKSAIEDTIVTISSVLLKATVWVVVGLEILSIWNIDLSPLLASAGIIGIVIGFAAQETIKNLFGGISISLDKSLKVGDWVFIDGAKMKVHKLGIRATQFLTLDGTLKIYPNSYIAENIIENLSEPPIPKKVKITVGVAYGSDPEKVKKVLKEEAEKTDKVKKDSIAVFMTNMGAYSIDFLLVCEVPSIDDVWPVKTTLIENIYNRLRQEGIEIPFPTNTVYLKKE